MKRLLLLLLIIISGTYIKAQSSTATLNGKYGFKYNEKKHMVQFIASSNTFIEYDEKGNQITDGEFVKKDDTYYLTPIVKSNASEISLPVNFRILESLPKKLVVVFNSKEVDSKSLNLYKL